MSYKRFLPCVGILLITVSHFHAHGESSKLVNVSTPKSPHQGTSDAGLLDRVLIHPSGSSFNLLNEFSHPLDPLTATEIRSTALIIRAANRTLKLQFKCIALHEPKKAVLLPYFLADTTPPPGIDREAAAEVVDTNTLTPYWVIVNLSKMKVVSWTPGKENQAAASITAEDIDVVKKVVNTDPSVVDRFKKLGLNPDYMVVDLWEAGYVADNPNYSKVRKLIQVFLYYFGGLEDVVYGHPLDFVVYVDLKAKRIVGIENLPIQQSFDTQNRTGSSVPRNTEQYFSESNLKQNVSPLKITQPGGPSFKLDGRLISWQNFKIRVGFNTREGILLHQISYTDNGKVRPLFYRISLSESFVQYTDPRPPYLRRSSHDMGNFEFGSSTQELRKHQLCRGEARYFDAELHNENAVTRVVKNAICVWEEDAGILYAHRESISGKTIVARSQRLSISQFVNIGSADYFLSWRFYQDATIELSVKFLGILNTNLLAVDVKPPPYGDLLSNQVYAQNFVYYMSARIDPDIDGTGNTVTVEDPVSIPDKAGNPYGNGVTIKSTTFKTAGESPSDIKAGRFWRISNPNNIQTLNSKPTSWKLIPQGPTMPSLYAQDSPLISANEWTQHNTWILPFNDDQILVDDLYLDGGVATWTKENSSANIENTDVVIWHVFNFFHDSDPEDWPMLTSCPEYTGFRLRPSNFFAENPAKTVPLARETTRLDGDNGWNSGPSSSGSGWS